MVTRPKFLNRLGSLTRPLNAASGTSAMLPVSSSDPAITTRIRPRLNTEPAKKVGNVPQIFGSMPAVVVVATSAPNAMYAPARNDATSALSHDRPALVAPVSIPLCVISGGCLNAIRLPPRFPLPFPAYPR
jgi:hypothetical protein